MVLYELICITRSSLPEATLREIAKTAGSQVVQNGGVVRSVANWGVRPLPKPVKKYQATYDDGNYMVMKFDTNRASPPCVWRTKTNQTARVQKDVSLTIKLDPRVLRHSIVKLGDKLDALQ